MQGIEIISFLLYKYWKLSLKRFIDFNHYCIEIYVRMLTQNEFIIPLSPELKSMYEDGTVAHSLKSLDCVSIRLKMSMSDHQ